MNLELDVTINLDVERDVEIPAVNADVNVGTVTEDVHIVTELTNEG